MLVHRRACIGRVVRQDSVVPPVSFILMPSSAVLLLRVSTV